MHQPLHKFLIRITNNVHAQIKNLTLRKLTYQDQSKEEKK